MITLPRGAVVENSSDDDIDEIGDPHRHTRTGVARDGKGGSDRHEQNIRETEQQTQADVQADASPDLARRERQADDGENEGGGSDGDAPFVLDFEIFDISDAAGLLLVDIFLEFG